MKTLRHGDWTFIPFTEKIPKEAKKIQLTQNNFTFAEGEATGHFHTLHVPKLEDMKFYKMPDDSYFVKILKNGYATHPEHSMKNDLIIPAGIYKLYQRREKDWFSLTTRRVLD